MLASLVLYNSTTASYGIKVDFRLFRAADLGCIFFFKYPLSTTVFRLIPFVGSKIEQTKLSRPSVK